MEIAIALAVLVLLFWLGFHLTGAFLSALFWIFIKLPLAILVFCVGLCLCATLLLIPIGLKCFPLAFKILF